MKKIDTTQSTWFKRYQPQTIDDLILPKKIKDSFKRYVETGSLPALALFSNTPGTGKSSTANAIINDFGGEALWINASLDTSVDTLRSKIQKFASTVSFDDKLKVVVLDEFDGFSKQGQAAFRGFIDEFSSNCTFIFTGNYRENVIEPLMDRLEDYEYSTFKRDEMIKPIFERLQFILNNENITFKNEDLVPIITTFYPCIRSMVKVLQKFSDGPGSTLIIDQQNLDNIQQFDNVMKFVSPKTYFELIESVNNLASPENMYSFIYKNVSKYFAPNSIPQAIVVTAKYQSMSSNVRDKHLPLCACLTDLIPLRL